MTATDFAPRAAALAARLRSESPLVVNITN